MSGVTSRAAGVHDVASLARIAAASEHARWTEAVLLEQLALSRTRALVIEEAGHIAGFAVGWQVLDELELHLIAIDPVRRRRGLAGRLLAAFEEGAAVVHLEVSERNAPALALYRARGYTEVGRRPDYYGPREAALLMKRIRR